MTLDLPMIWAALIAFAVLAYVLLDGFDLGVGILFPLIKGESNRDEAMNSVAPVWDGNETWLVLGGGGCGERRQHQERGGETLHRAAAAAAFAAWLARPNASTVRMTRKVEQNTSAIATGTSVGLPMSSSTPATNGPTSNPISKPE